MTGVIAIVAVAVFLAGLALGACAAVAVAVRREDRSYSGGQVKRPGG